MICRLTYRQAIDAAINEASRHYLRDVIEQAGGNISQAARAAGLNRTYLYELLRRYGIQVQAQPQRHRGSWSDALSSV
jgi:DNA-binding NtrC family response regulator